MSDLERRVAEARDRLGEAKRTQRVAEFGSALLKAAQEQAAAMGSTEPIKLSGEFEGGEFMFYVELTDNKEK